ncbi:MAG: ATP synthase F1 subunit delta [Bdellovibrionales bacterium]|nr:ATP synthase F1 subunit delta [Bdellovibrionales bacterium]
MAQDKVSYRYAKAIFDYVKDGANLRSLIAELKEFAQTVSTHSELSLVLTSDIYSTEDRHAILKDLFLKKSLSETAKRVLLVLSSAKRLGLVASIAERLQLILLESTNVMPLIVETATTLEADEKKKIEEKFQTLLGKKVEATYIVVPSLIGGLKATAGGRTYDGSLVGWLNSFEDILISG